MKPDLVAMKRVSGKRTIGQTKGNLRGKRNEVRAKLMTEMSLRGASGMQIAEAFQVSRGVVTQSLKAAEVNHWLDEVRDRMRAELMPKAERALNYVLDTDAATLEEHPKAHALKAKVATKLAEGFGVIGKAALVQTKVTETLDLDGYIAKRTSLREGITISEHLGQRLPGAVESTSQGATIEPRQLAGDLQSGAQAQLAGRERGSGDSLGPEWVGGAVQQAAAGPRDTAVGGGLEAEGAGEILEGEVVG